MQTSLIAKCTETRHTCAPNTFVLSALLQLLLPRVLVGINFWQFYLVVDAVRKRFHKFWQCSRHLSAVPFFREPFQADWYLFTNVRLLEQVQTTGLNS